jgi:glycosyltransferase involved in cell wall biosynthesis
MPTSDVTVLLPVLNETESLRETVEVLFQNSPEDIAEILILTAARTTEDSLFVLKELQEEFPGKVRKHQQRLPYLGGALREGIDLVSTEYTLIMSSDLETDPHYAYQLIDAIKQRGCDAVIGSRWKVKDGLKGYPGWKLACNYAFQKGFSSLFHTSLSDMTFSYGVRRTAMLQGIVWEELGHAFLFECVVKPLRLGFSTEEIPIPWRSREEGESQSSLSIYGPYFRIGLKTRLTPSSWHRR